MNSPAPILFALITILSIVVCFLLVRLSVTTQYAKKLRKMIMEIEGEIDRGE